MKIELVKANANDFELIGELAKSIWNLHYIEIITQEQIDFMLQKMYNAQSLANQMQNEGHMFYLIKENATTTIGFLSVSSNDKKNWMLHKFYILQNDQKKGVGTKVFNLLIQELNQPFNIRLTVNRQNFKSINFYFKNGFVIEKVADFDIGNGYFMNDFVMLWNKK